MVDFSSRDSQRGHASYWSSRAVLIRQMTPGERRLRALAAAHAKWGRLGPEERRAQTASARRARYDRYLRRADPDGVLDEAERERRADHLRRADMARMSMKAAQARRARPDATRKIRQTRAKQVAREAGVAVVVALVPDPAKARDDGSSAKKRRPTVVAPLAVPNA
jgi:hypothetical protein